MYFDIISSPVGPLLLAGQNSHLRLLSFLKKRTTKPFIDPSWTRRRGHFNDVQKQLVEYFNGQRREFDVAIEFGTPESTFSAQVWRALRRIPYGETRSYRDIANSIGRHKAYRAVGQANHRNPVAIIVPCHRVIGSDGKLTGFGGGLDTKKYLLDLESRTSHTTRAPRQSRPSEHFNRESLSLVR